MAPLGWIRGTLCCIVLPVLFFVLLTGSASAGPVMEADAFARQWWAQHGSGPKCSYTLDRQLEGHVGEARRLTYVHPDGSYEFTQCSIHVNPVMLLDLKDPDRFVRREAWIKLAIVLIHEIGHLANVAGPLATGDEEHALGGIMSAYLDDIRPPASVIEWAIRKTRR